MRFIPLLMAVLAITASADSTRRVILDTPTGNGHAVVAAMSGDRPPVRFVLTDRWNINIALMELQTGQALALAEWFSEIDGKRSRVARGEAIDLPPMQVGQIEILATVRRGYVAAVFVDHRAAQRVELQLRSSMLRRFERGIVRAVDAAG
jgi:hypothetical protein